MTGLVEQLQADALDQNVSVATLLGKVKVCAVRLGLDDALEWVQSELCGYPKSSGVVLPAYRLSNGVTLAQNEYMNWMPIAFEDAEWANLVRSIELREPVLNYEEALKTDQKLFYLPLEPHQVNMLSDACGQRFFAVKNQLARGHIQSVVGRVRDLVLASLIHDCVLTGSIRFSAAV